MAIGTLTNAGDILNRVAAEVGIQPVVSPYTNIDPAFIQMQYLLNTAGEELMYSAAWELLVRSHQFVTAVGDTGVYDLPDDFAYMINQTLWERSENIPLGGPLSAQEWTYLKGRDFASSTLYASFRIAQGTFNLYPDPPAVGLDINFEYITKNWAVNSDGDPIDRVATDEDVPQFDRTLITRAVKVKFLEAGGFDTTKAQADLNQIFGLLTGNEKASPVLDAGRNGFGIPYLGDGNIPFTNFGL